MREGVSNGQSGPLYISIWTSSNLHSAHPIQNAWKGGGLPSAPAVPIASQFGGEVISFLIETNVLRHSDRACLRESERELIKMLSAHMDSLFFSLFFFYTIIHPASCGQINKRAAELPPAITPPPPFVLRSRLHTSGAQWPETLS